MNKGRLIGGIICLAIAVVLLILWQTLEEDQMMFQIGDRNMPWVPAVVLGVIGIALLATVNQGVEPRETSAEEGPPPAGDPEKAALNKRMEAVAWGLFLIMVCCRLLVPAAAVPKGVWSIGVGLIMLGLNLARYLTGIKLSGFTVFLGIVAIIGGILSLVGLPQIEGPIFLIVLGAYVLLKPRFDRGGLFGSSEEREAGQ
jgi:hypothetical protein